MQVREIGAAIRAARKGAGLTQADLGDFIGADRFAIADIERGEVTAQVRRLLDLIDILGLEIVVRPRTLGLASQEEPEP